MIYRNNFFLVNFHYMMMMGGGGVKYKKKGMKSGLGGSRLDQLLGGNIYFYLANAISDILLQLMRRKFAVNYSRICANSNIG